MTVEGAECGLKFCNKFVELFLVEHDSLPYIQALDRVSAYSIFLRKAINAIMTSEEAQVIEMIHQNLVKV